MTTFCGLDFGTSNSTIGICPDRSPQLINLENNRPIIRSAIFCDAETKSWVFGQEGVNRYLESVPGRLMMSLKSVLGSSLMEDETLIFNEFIPYTKVLGHFIRHLKTIAEQTSGKELTQAVLGRPVYFHDHDAEKDRYAEVTLEKIAKEAGFKDIIFQLEPIAAALTYETSITSEQLALIIDMGGGTSDFTVIRLQPGSKASDRSKDILANSGIHIAGTDFDQRLSINKVMPLLGFGSLMQGSSSDIEVPSSYYYDLTTWHMLSQLYSAATISHVQSIQTKAYEKTLITRLIKVLQARAGHKILHTVELSKQHLSDVTQDNIDLNFIEKNLQAVVRREDFNRIIHDYLQRILETITQTLLTANVKAENISALFYTGGSTKIPFIRQQINALFPNAEVIQGDAFGSVGMGLTIDAQRKFG